MFTSQSDFVILESPSEKFSSPKAWIETVLPKIIEINRQKIVLFDQFPPEYVDYYQALQEHIALMKGFEEEVNRPLIVLNIKGKNRLDEVGQADIGMAGGTGPLSDATALNNLVCHMSKQEPPLEGKRTEVANRMQNFSAVLYSMPPPRPQGALDLLQGALLAGINYTSLYKSARTHYSCVSLFLLTNTGHSRKALFDSRFLGENRFGSVIDLTEVVADEIKPVSSPVLILGTLAADKAKLYPNLLAARKLMYALPTENYKNIPSNAYLQRLIDQAKAGKVNENMPGEQITCGQAFIDFIVFHAEKTQCASLLFSCTELPMILHTKIHGSDLTYMEQLVRTLKDRFPEKSFPYFDSEHIFVKTIAKHSREFQRNPELKEERAASLQEFRSDDIANAKDTFLLIKKQIEDEYRMLAGHPNRNPQQNNYMEIYKKILDYFNDSNNIDRKELIKLIEKNISPKHRGILLHGIALYKLCKIDKITMDLSYAATMYIPGSKTQQPIIKNSDPKELFIRLINELIPLVPKDSSKELPFTLIRHAIETSDNDAEKMQNLFILLCNIAVRIDNKSMLKNTSPEGESLKKLLNQTEYAIFTKWIPEISGKENRVSYDGLRELKLPHSVIKADVTLYKIALIADLNKLLKYKKDKTKSTYAHLASHFIGGRDWDIEDMRIKLTVKMINKINAASELSEINNIIKKYLKRNIANSISWDATMLSFGQLHDIVKPWLTMEEQQELNKFIDNGRCAPLRIHTSHAQQEKSLSPGDVKNELENDREIASKLCENLKSIYEKLKDKFPSAEKRLESIGSSLTTEGMPSDCKKWIDDLTMELQCLLLYDRTMKLYDKLITHDETVKEDKSVFMKEVEQFLENFSIDNLRDVIFFLSNSIIPALENKIDEFDEPPQSPSSQMTP